MSTGTFAGRLAEIAEIRAVRPAAIAEAAARRVRSAAPPARLMIIAADHPARGALRAGGDPLALGDRADLLERMCVALARPGVDGVLGTPDVIEDLLLLGALEGKVVIGSMNRGGLAGAAFEADDRFTAYTAPALARARLDGGKMLLRVDLADPATARTLEACAHAVTDLAAHGLMALVEPFMSSREGGGRLRNLLTPEAMVHAVSIASGLGATSAHTWLKVPVVDRMEEVMAASTLPALLLGGEVPADPDAALAGWKAALALPTVRGLVVGRSLLYPPGGDVAGAVDAAAGLL
ncbi:aldolase [Actinomadura graeca]|uniref:Aldolase n=1 Tax=Actinomadura graeca TaxID=2750812 RepID=A0ABX8QNF8_9ACTN|nr:aldolase [Actinomadura graeca]QXJ20222.1 aldolase [Actinomadura graeca]